jgi:hypothetical protein
MMKGHCPTCTARVVLFVVCLGGALPPTSTLAQSAAIKPNILFILADNLGYGEVGFPIGIEQF